MALKPLFRACNAWRGWFTAILRLILLSATTSAQAERASSHEQVSAFVEQTATQPGYGWVHYQWPEPKELFPSWKSTYIRRAVGPEGERYLVGSGQYDMPLTRPLLVDLVADAARLMKAEGLGAFPRLRDESHRFIFMDIYVFVLDTTGTEWANPAFPNLEGRNL